MTRLRHGVVALLAGAVSVALGASAIAQAQREAPPIPPQAIPNAGQRTPPNHPGHPRQRRWRTAGSAVEIRANSQAPAAEAGSTSEANTTRSPDTSYRGPAVDRSAAPGHAAAARRAGDTTRSAARRRRTRRAVAGGAQRTRGSGLRRLPARPLHDRVDDRDPARRAQRRRQGDGAARRALRLRPRREAGRHQGRRLVPARRRPRRPRGDVRARHAAHGGPRRTGQSRGSREAARRRGAAQASDGVLQSRPALSRRPAVPAGFRARRRAASAWPPKPAARRRNTRSPRSTRKAAA